MIPPPDAVQAIQRVHHSFRIGWTGSPTPDCPAGGQFAFLQIMHRHDARKKELWNDRGPVYGAKWDHDIRVPILLAYFEPAEVFNGSFILKVRRWIRPMWARIVESAEAKAAKVNANLQNLSGQAGEQLYYDIHHAANAGPAVPRKAIPAPIEKPPRDPTELWVHPEDKKKYAMATDAEKAGPQGGV